jgi:hypothetical protein
MIFNAMQQPFSPLYLDDIQRFPAFFYDQVIGKLPQVSNPMISMVYHSYHRFWESYDLHQISQPSARRFCGRTLGFGLIPLFYEA